MSAVVMGDSLDRRKANAIKSHQATVAGHSAGQFVNGEYSQTGHYQRAHYMQADGA